MIDYDFLENEYDNLPARERVLRNNKPQGSLTDNVRIQKVQRDAAYKKVRQYKEMGYYNE